MTKEFKPPHCPYCQEQAVLMDSARIYHGHSYGLIWACLGCKAWVGTHKSSPNNAPLGRLANEELRKWKIQAHARFDLLWKNHELSRKDAYQKLSEVLGIPVKQAHIGYCDIEQCKKIVESFKRGKP